MTIVPDVLLASKASLRVGGRARFWCRVEKVEELREALSYSRDHDLPILVLGGGTNVIPTDAGFDGLVIEVGNIKLDWDEAAYTAHVGAGMPMATLVTLTTQRGWSDLSWAGGLPGTLGGAIRGNAGAFGGEIRDSIISVDVWDMQTDRLVTLGNDACGFGYRTSKLKEMPIIIWSATLQCIPGDPAELIRQRDEHILYRQTRHAIEPSAGSIFKNLYVADLPSDFFTRFPEFFDKVRGEKLATGVLLDALSMKGRTFGGAAISERHANMIINPEGKASATDVRELAGLMKKAVLERFGVELVEEPEFL